MLLLNDISCTKLPTLLQSHFRLDKISLLIKYVLWCCLASICCKTNSKICIVYQLCIVCFVLQELEAIKARVLEMEQEAEKLKEMQSEVEKQMNLSSSSASKYIVMCCQ